MSQKIFDKCPSCGNDLSISSLKCNSCGIEIKGDFEIPKQGFEQLTEQDIDFIKTFLKWEGNISSVQKELNIGYLTTKSRLRSINRKLGNGKKYSCDDMNFRFNLSSLGKPSLAIMHKLRINDGGAICPMLRGEPMNIWITPEGVANSAYKDLICEWRIFDAIVYKAYELGKKMYKGDSAAQNGARIGSDELPLDTIDSYISLAFYDKQIGETTLRRSTYYASILAWAGICFNSRSMNGEGGYILLNPDWLDDSRYDPSEEEIKISRYLANRKEEENILNSK